MHRSERNVRIKSPCFAVLAICCAVKVAASTVQADPMAEMLHKRANRSSGRRLQSRELKSSHRILLNSDPGTGNHPFEMFDSDSKYCNASRRLPLFGRDGKTCRQRQYARVRLYCLFYYLNSW